jgi:hypothetical protein
MDADKKTGLVMGRALFIILLVATAISGCSSNSLIIRFMYGQMDNNLNQRLLAYADFNSLQEQEIQQAVDDFFAWHRRSELPRYAELLGQIENQIKAGSINQQFILDRMTQVRVLAEVGFSHSPIAASATFLRNLSDQQVSQIAEHFAQQDKEFFEWLEQRKKKDNKDTRVKSITKNMARLGIYLNQSQQEIIAEGLDRYEGGPVERFEVWSRWETMFVEILEHRSEEGFKSRITAHLNAYQSQMRLAYPEREQRNRENSAGIIDQVIENFDQQQIQAFTNKLAQARKTLLSISAG